MKFLATSLVLLSSAAHFVAAQSANCGFPPNMECMIQASQYTVVGTVVSNTRNSTGTPQNYNATIAIRCNFASNGATGNTGADVQGQTVLVTSFGSRTNRCPQGSSSEATVGETRIFFIHVSTFRPRNGEARFYSIVDVCVGGLPFNEDNLKKIASFLKANPKNAISDSFKGPASECTLPQVEDGNDSNANADVGSNDVAKPPTNSQSKNSAVASFLTVLAFIGALAYL